MLNDIMTMASYNGNKQFEVLSYIANNVAGMNVQGYKSKRFEQYLRSDGVLSGTERVDTSQGTLKITRKELDIAIDGAGYIPVTQPDGTTAYTRDGSLAKNSKGYLVTPTGDMVGGGIQLPANYHKVIIDPDGGVKVMETEHEQHPKLIGKISVVNFANPEQLQSIGYNKLVVTPASGQPVLNSTSKVIQGKLEHSNVNVYYQVDQIMRLNASLISNFRVVKFADDIYRQAASLRQ